MAHGKSLEDWSFDVEPKVLCATCREPWEGHLKKDGELKKKYKDHVSSAAEGSRSRRRAFGIRTPQKPHSSSGINRPKALPALATHVAVPFDSLSDEQKRAMIKRGEKPKGKRKLVTIQVAPEVFRKQES